MQPCAMTSRLKQPNARARIVRVKQEILKNSPPWDRRSLLRLQAVLFDEYANRYYSQEREDIILQRIFFGKSRGFYVDVGAHHPRHFSNTYAFYRCGWSGINIEPNRGMIKLFRKERNRGINLQLGIDSRENVLKYHLFNDPAVRVDHEGRHIQVHAATKLRIVCKGIQHAHISQAGSGWKQ